MSKKVAIIPARSGSKGLPNKNILMLLDKPLLAYTIEAALNSGEFDKVIVSTDSEEYREIAEQYGAEVFLRGEELSSDTASSYLVVEDVLNRVGVDSYEYFALLQPTSPFRSAGHIKQAIKSFDSSDANFLVSVTQSDKSSILINPIDDSGKLSFFDTDFSTYRRQNKSEYAPNGAIFLARCTSYLDKKHFFGKDSLAYIMNKEDSVDIDDKLDFELAINIESRKRKQEILTNNILERIDEKRQFMNQCEDLTLIGHSLFDYWDISTLNNRSVNNLGIAGINTRQYIDYILKAGLLTKVGNTVLIFAGTNDIVVNEWTKKLSLDWVLELTQRLSELNPQSQLYLIEVPRVLGRIDRANSTIKELNSYLKNNLPDNLSWIDLGDDFQDKYGNLKASFTYDGLHFTPEAYGKLEQLLESYI